MGTSGGYGGIGDPYAFMQMMQMMQGSQPPRGNPATMEGDAGMADPAGGTGSFVEPDKAGWDAFMDERNTETLGMRGKLHELQEKMAGLGDTNPDKLAKLQGRYDTLNSDFTTRQDAWKTGGRADARAQYGLGGKATTAPPTPTAGAPGTPFFGERQQAGL